MDFNKIEQQIIAKVLELWGSMRSPDISVTFGTGKDKNGVDIQITQEYSPPGCTFAQLQALSEFFHTTRIGEDYEIDNPGCDTCDYGSRYGFVLRILPENNGGESE